MAEVKGGLALPEALDQLRSQCTTRQQQGGRWDGAGDEMAKVKGELASEASDQLRSQCTTRQKEQA